MKLIHHKTLFITTISALMIGLTCSSWARSEFQYDDAFISYPTDWSAESKNAPWVWSNTQKLFCSAIDEDPVHQNSIHQTFTKLDFDKPTLIDITWQAYVTAPGAFIPNGYLPYLAASTYFYTAAQADKATGSITARCTSASCMVSIAQFDVTADTHPKETHPKEIHRYADKTFSFPATALDLTPGILNQVRLIISQKSSSAPAVDTTLLSLYLNGENVGTFDLGATLNPESMLAGATTAALFYDGSYLSQNGSHDIGDTCVDSITMMVK